MLRTVPRVLGTGCALTLLLLALAATQVALAAGLPAVQGALLEQRGADATPVSPDSAQSTGLFLPLVSKLHVLGSTPPSAPVLDPTATPTANSTPEPTATPTNAPTDTPTATPTSIPPLTIGPGTADEILMPAGNFQMGCDVTNPAEICDPSEQPAHTVSLAAYAIDKYEVTNARYKACMDAAGCTAPQSVNSATHAPYFGDPAYADYPVIRVNWTQADAFCRWEGKRLPSEAEWERAARGASDTRTYPWGDAAPDCTTANYLAPSGSCASDTTRVGTYPAGVGPEGVMDMAGNVWEWVNDWYQPDYYNASPAANPPGPDTGTVRAQRGGSWLYSESFMRAAYRDYDYPFVADNDTGFRCARTQ